MPAAGQKCRCCARMDAQEAQLEARNEEQNNSQDDGRGTSADRRYRPEPPTDQTAIDIQGLDFMAWERVALDVFRPRAAAVPAAMLNGHAELHLTWHWVPGRDDQSEAGVPIVHHMHSSYRVAREAIAQHRPVEEQPVSPRTQFFNNPRLDQTYRYRPWHTGVEIHGSREALVISPSGLEPPHTSAAVRSSVDEETTEPNFKRTASAACLQEDVMASDVELPAGWFDDSSDSSVVINMADIPEWPGEGESGKRRRLNLSGSGGEEEASSR